MSDRSSEARARVALSLLGEPGDGDLGELVGRFGAREAVQIILASDHEAVGWQPRRWRAARARWDPRLNVLTTNDQMDRARRAEAQLIVPGDDLWPTRVDDLDHFAPLLLWVRGDAAALQAPQAIAIVGARAATGYGEFVASDLAGALARTGAVVVSGGAYGIDGCAHRAALETGGTTIAVMAGGVDRPYPAGHASLIAQIARTGVVVSEVPLGVTPSRWRFLSRNRVIAALADATVVVEAGWRSGSLNTAGHAAALGRPLGAVPGPVTSAASAGCHRLLREYDAVCVTTPDNVRELAGWSEQPSEPETYSSTPGHGNASSAEVRVTDALTTKGPRDAAEVARRSGLSVAEVQATLGLMLLDGLVESTDRGYRLSTSKETQALASPRSGVP